MIRGLNWIMKIFAKKSKDVEYPVCLRCGRRLKSAEARERGYGPKCYMLHLSETSHQQKLF